MPKTGEEPEEPENPENPEDEEQPPTPNERENEWQGKIESLSQQIQTLNTRLEAAEKRNDLERVTELEAKLSAAERNLAELKAKLETPTPTPPREKEAAPKRAAPARARGSWT